jgi:hypothetical protein
LLYEYKSTNADAALDARYQGAKWYDAMKRSVARSLEDKVLSLLDLLVQKYKYCDEAERRPKPRGQGPQFTCFTGTKVRILTREELQTAASLGILHHKKPLSQRQIASKLSSAGFLLYPTRQRA